MTVVSLYCDPLVLGLFFFLNGIFVFYIATESFTVPNLYEAEGHLTFRPHYNPYSD